jgi:hypothetical protein
VCFQKDCRTWAHLANPASAPKFPDTQSLQLATSPSILPASFTFKSTLSASYHPRQDFNTASRRLTVSDVGQKLSPFLTSQLKQCHVPCWRAGYHILAAHNHHRPGTPGRVTAFPQPSEGVCYTHQQEDPVAPRNEWPHGKPTSATEDRHHVPRR